MGQLTLLSLHRTTIARLRNSVLIAFIIALVFVIVDAFQEWKVPQLYLRVSMKSSVDSIAQVFYDIGNGLNEKDSINCSVNKNRGFQVLRFPLPRKPIKYIRFDPLIVEGNFSLREIQLVDELDRLIQTIDLEAVKPLHQISSIGIENDLLVATTTSKANDPMLCLDLAYPLSLNLAYPLAHRVRDYIVENFAHAHKKFLIVFVLSWAAMLFAFFDQKNIEDDPDMVA